jgi:hypothetical protein
MGPALPPVTGLHFLPLGAESVIRPARARPTLDAMPPVLFDVAWDALELDNVRAFLSDAGEESVTWEAKADDDDQRARAAGQEPGRLGKQTIRKAVCGLANQIGGYVIVGARRAKASDPWQLPGVTGPNIDEPEGWLRTVISEHGVNPVPMHDVKAWPLGDGAFAAVIAVEPVVRPPCMTAQGHIYERVSGDTKRVTDAAMLARLFDCGRTVGLGTEQLAIRAAGALLFDDADDRGRPHAHHEPRRRADRACH